MHHHPVPAIHHRRVQHDQRGKPFRAALGHQVHDYRPQRMSGSNQRLGQGFEPGFQLQAEAMPVRIHRVSRIVAQAIDDDDIELVRQRCQKGVIAMAGNAVGVGKDQRLTTGGNC